MPKIYTKTGDTGETSLYCGKRISKDDYIFDILGNIDELSCRIGFLYSLINTSEINISCNLKDIQQNLQHINSIIATEDPIKQKKLIRIDENDVNFLELTIDNIEKNNLKLTTFILPGENMKDAQSHLCRTQTRLVERLLWNFYKRKDIMNSQLDFHYTLKYINRLSDFFFVLARFLSKN